MFGMRFDDTFEIIAKKKLNFVSFVNTPINHIVKFLILDDISVFRMAFVSEKRLS